MDITRGSRRARHVAAARASANATSSPSARHGGAAAPEPVAASSPAGTPGSSARLAPGHGASPAAALVTPDAPPPLHRTPDQPSDQRRRRAPPPNPFRLYRMPPLSASARPNAAQLDCPL
ncbi:hypothetical protein ACJZ2D_004195 [Fusarium nematophilum]